MSKLMRDGTAEPVSRGQLLRRERSQETRHFHIQLTTSRIGNHMYGHTYSKSMDQPGKVANPARGQLNKENNIPLSAFVPENLVSHDDFGSPVPRQPAHLHTQAESGAYLRDFSRVPRRRPYIHIKPPYAIGYASGEGRRLIRSFSQPLNASLSMLSKELEVTQFVKGERTKTSRNSDDCPTSPANSDERRGGAGGGDKVITTGRSKWDSAHAYLVTELRSLIRTRDLALAHQRVRHVKESIVIREQRHALASGPKFSEKLAKLFGWASVTGRSKPSSCVTPIPSALSGHRGGDALSTKDDGDERAPTVARAQGATGLTHEKTHISCDGISPVEIHIPRVSAGESGEKSAEAGVIATAINPATKFTCASCLELQVKLQTAITDRALAEAELVSLRRTFAPDDTPKNRKLGIFTCRDEFINMSTNPVGPVGKLLSEMGNQDGNGQDLGKELRRLEAVVALEERRLRTWTTGMPYMELTPESSDRGRKEHQIKGVEHVLETQTPDSKTADGAFSEASAVGPAKEFSLDAALSSSIESSARHFEEMTQWRLLRASAAADLRAARTKLDVIRRISPPACHSYPDAKVKLEAGNVASSHFDNGTREPNERDPKVFESSDEKLTIGSGDCLPNGGRDALDRLDRGQGNRSPQHEQGEMGDPSSSLADTAAPSAKRLRSFAKASPTRKNRLGVRGNHPATCEVRFQHVTKDPTRRSTKKHQANANEPRPDANIDLDKTRPRSSGKARGGPNSPKKIKPSALGDCATIKKDEHRFPEPVIEDKVGVVSTLSNNFKVAIIGAGSAKNEAICEDTARDRSLTSEADGEHPSRTALPERCGEVKPATRDKPFHGARRRTPERPPKETRSPRFLQQKDSERISFHHVRSPRSPESGRIAKGQARPTTKTTEEQPEIGASKTRPDGAVEESITECRRGPDRGIVVETYPDRCSRADGDATDRLANDTCPSAGRMGAKAFEDNIVSKGGRKRTASAMVVRDKNKGKSRTLRSPYRVVRSPKCLRSVANAKKLSGADETVGKDTETQESTGPVAKESLQSPDVLEQVAKDGCGCAESGANQTSVAFHLACNSTLCSVDKTEAEGEARDKDLETIGTIYGEEDSALSVEKAADPSSTRNYERVTGGSAGDLEQGSAGGGKAEARCNGTTELKLRTPALQETNGSSCIICRNSGLDALRAKVDDLHSEKAELEDTLAQLNVAAAQLYLVEYEQMKEKCRQLQRIVLGTTSKPTEQTSGLGHSCQEVMFRLKLLGLNFFRRRIGGIMGDNFFPEGLSRVLTLIGRPRKDQGCQTPSSGLEQLEKTDTSSALAKRDVRVQVAGGIDAEDEPLMEQQVYAFLGKLELALKYSESVMSAYHGEAKEGAREARALLASAAADPRSRRGWAVLRVPKIREMVGGREGPAGAPRPAINPTNLLFTAASCLDSVATVAIVKKTEDCAIHRMRAVGEGENGSRCNRYSSAEKALLTLADEVIAALESEQRRSDDFAQRRRLAPGKKSGSCCEDMPTLRRPPVGVPPLIWGMSLHLVGKLAKAFRAAVEARGFEREVADADLVAAVTLGCSSPTAAQGSQEELNPWYAFFSGDEHRDREKQKKNQDLDTVREDRCDWDVYYNPTIKSNRPKRGGLVGTDGGNCDTLLTTQSFRHTANITCKRPGRSFADRRAEKEYQCVCPQRPTKLGGSSKSKMGRCLDAPEAYKKQQPPRHASVAAALVEAAAVDTVRPSLLHRRPASASFDGRKHSDIMGCGGSVYREEGKKKPRPWNREDTESLRPQSARLADLPDLQGKAKGLTGGIDGDVWDGKLEINTQGDRWLHEKQGDLEVKQYVQPAVAMHPASAGARVVDTRTWTSTVVQSDALRSRPQSSVQSGTSSASLSPTCVGQVPAFLARKEREEREHAERERAAAIYGRFEVIPANDDDNKFAGDVGAWLGEGRTVGVVATGESLLSSVEQDKSVATEDLLPNVEGKASSDAWKPTGYGFDLSRYDSTGDNRPQRHGS